MKSIKGFIMEDMWEHVLMSGPEISGYIKGEKYQNREEQLAYCKGIIAVFPHMLLRNFSQWLWGDTAPMDYAAFMEHSIPELTAMVDPVLERCFAADVPSGERGNQIVSLLTDVVPKYMLNAFYSYIFSEQEGYKDMAEFWKSAEPLLGLMARILRLAYSDSAQLLVEERAEVFLLIGTRYPYLLLNRWYDWQFGVEEFEMPAQSA